MVCPSMGDAPRIHSLLTSRRRTLEPIPWSTWSDGKTMMTLAEFIRDFLAMGALSVPGSGWMDDLGLPGEWSGSDRARGEALLESSTVAGSVC